MWIIRVSGLLFIVILCIFTVKSLKGEVKLIFKEEELLKITYKPYKMAHTALSQSCINIQICTLIVYRFSYPSKGIFHFRAITDVQLLRIEHVRYM